MKKYTITTFTRKAIKGEDPYEEIRRINELYGENGWCLISTAVEGDEVTLFFQIEKED